MQNLTIWRNRIGNFVLQILVFTNLKHHKRIYMFIDTNRKGKNTLLLLKEEINNYSIITIIL